MPVYKVRGWDDKVYNMQGETPEKAAEGLEEYLGPKPSFADKMLASFGEAKESASAISEGIEEHPGLGVGAQAQMLLTDTGAALAADTVKNAYSELPYDVRNPINTAASAVADAVGGAVGGVVDKTAPALGMIKDSLEDSGYWQSAETVLGGAYDGVVDYWQTLDPFEQQYVASTGKMLGLTPAPTKPLAKKTGGAFFKAKRKSLKHRYGKTKDLIEPIDVANKEAFGSVEEGRHLGVKGPIRKRNAYWMPDEKTLDVTEQLSKTRGFKPQRGLTYNIRVVTNEIETKAKLLRQRITDAGNPLVDIDDVTSDFRVILDDIAANPRKYDIPGTDTKVNVKDMEGWLKTWEDGLVQGQTRALDLLDARQGFDKLVRNAIGDKVFYGESGTGVREFVRQVRKGANSAVGRSVPKAQIDELLHQQHLLYRGRDELLRPKRAQINTMKWLENLTHKMHQTSHVRMPSTPLAIFTTGAFGLQVARTWGSWVAGGATAGAGYAGLVLLKHPKTQVRLKGVLHQIAKALDKAQDIETRRVLNLERLVVLEMLNDAEEIPADAGQPQAPAQPQAPPPVQQQPLQMGPATTPIGRGMLSGVGQ
mgnify:CR=1 FL=1